MHLVREEKVDSKQLSQSVTNQIKAFRKSVGTSLEGFEEQITGLFLALEARKKDKQNLMHMLRRMKTYN